MAKKQQLLNEATERERRNRVRAEYEREIVGFLPHNLEVTRVYIAPSHTQKNNNCQGQIDIDVETLAQAVDVIAKLDPAPMSKVTVRRSEGTPLISFYPNDLVPRDWHCEVRVIYPVLLQVTPKAGSKSEPMVYLEWFVKIKPTLFANVRVRASKHGIRYTLAGSHFKPEGLPKHTYMRVMATPSGSAPSITAGWDRTYFNDGVTMKDLFTEVQHA